MKIAVIVCLLLVLLCILVQYLLARLHKKEFDDFYKNYVAYGHFVPPYVVFADNLGVLGTSLKAKWFLWILRGRKIKTQRNKWLDKKTYDFVQEHASKKLQSWIRLDLTLLIYQGIFLFLAEALILLINNEIIS
ncbi:hypothetical protein [Serratia sp. AKBS12]|uniref:hypothetical protein n=1 Tax=Serratia sp. AKBS12 TaxID=2974597 RepID=UPI002165F7C9|nr:hypothetical protein [Serratia sp. AKBS12]MCS3405892.1 hypothetical protein [Serratia sp. AKBS12]